MAGPVVYVSTWRIKEGRFEDYRRFHAELMKLIQDNEPRVVAFHLFANEDATEITGLHMYADTTAVESHMEMLAEKMGLLPGDLTKVFEFLEPVRIDVLGVPGERAMEMDKGLIESGVAYIQKPRHVDGFTRSTAV